MDEDGVIQPCGGVTIAYTVVPNLNQICASYVKCRPDELFCYAIGREQAAAKLKDTSPDGLEVLPLEHPISETLVDWIATDVWPAGPESRDMGFSIDISPDEKGRWVSTFEPSQYSFLLDQLDDNEIPRDAYCS